MSLLKVMTFEKTDDSKLQNSLLIILYSFVLMLGVSPSTLSLVF